MKTFIRTLFLVTILSTSTINAQEKYGRTLNMSLGIGYYYAAPTLHLNYEFDVFKNFTLAPFLGISTYRSYRYWGDSYYSYRDYYYRETIIPVGVKGTYYFDELLDADEKWDFYGAASLGAVFRSVTWERGYNGDRRGRNYATPLFASLHIGAEYHINQKAGIFLDLSTGYSTVGLGLHF